MTLGHLNRYSNHRKAKHAMTPTMTPTQYERIEAGEIKPGDRVARARSHSFQQVTAISTGPVAITLRFGRDIARPRRTAKWWRLQEAVISSEWPETLVGRTIRDLDGREWKVTEIETQDGEKVLCSKQYWCYAGEATVIDEDAEQ
jgi:hypothetical protein